MSKLLTLIVPPLARAVLARAREPSTWRGVIWITTAAGVVLSAEQATAIMAAGAAVAGLAGSFLPDQLRN